jgi:hypothetical protein
MIRCQLFRSTIKCGKRWVQTSVQSLTGPGRQQKLWQELPAERPDDSIGIESQLMQLSSPRSVLEVYKKHVASTQQTRDWRERRFAAASALVVASLALTRVSSTLQVSRAADLAISKSDALNLLVEDLHRQVSAALALPSHHPAHLAAREPRFVSSTLHSIARLHEQLALKQDTAFHLLLQAALTDDGIVGARLPSPHCLAQVAWAAAVYPAEVVLRTAAAVRGGECDHVLAHDWMWSSISAAARRLAAATSKATNLARQNVGAHPVDLSMLAAAFARSGYASQDGLVSVAELALRGRSDKAGSADEGPRSPLRAFSGAVLAAIPTSIAAAHASWARRSPSRHNTRADTIGEAIHATVSAAAASAQPSRSPQSDRRVSGMSPTTHPCVIELLVEISREVATRLAAAEESWNESPDVPPRRQLQRRFSSLPLRGSGGPSDSERSVRRRLVDAVDSVGGDSDVDVVDVAETAVLAHLPPPLTLSALAALLRAYATIGYRSPELFGSAAHFFGLVSASSGSDSGGEDGFRALGTHPEDKLGSVRDTSREISSHRVDAPDGDVAVISTAPFSILATIAAAFAKVRYADADDTPRMWAALLVSATRAVHLAVERSISSASQESQHATGVISINPTDLASILHACADASVAATPLARTALVHLSQNLSSFTVPTAARVLWAAALQGVYSPLTSAAVFRRVCRHSSAVLADKIGESLELGDEGALYATTAFVPEGSTSSQPSKSSAALPTRKQRSVRIVQSQLYMAWMGLSLEGPSDAITKAALDTVPQSVLSAWRSSYALADGDVHSSALHTEVSRLLSLASVKHELEFLLPEGIRVDVIVPAEFTTLHVAPGQHRRPVVVLEVNGPSHYAPSPQSLFDVENAAAAANRDALSPTFRPVDTLLQPVSLSTLASFRTTSESVFDLSERSDAGLAQRSPPLAPSLRTRARSRWIKAAGYACVTVDWSEWADRPSTEERLELLADKGIVIPRHLLSY